MAKKIHVIREEIPEAGWAGKTIDLEKHSGKASDCPSCFTKVLDPKGNIWIEDELEPQTIFELLKKMFGYL